MNVHDAIDQACAAVGIKPPRAYKLGQWAKTDTLSGKSGKGDGRLIVDEIRVTGWNWQTGEKETVWLKDKASPVERRQMAERQAKDDREHREKAARAAHIAAELVLRSTEAAHPYLMRKGFQSELALVLPAADVTAIGGDYLVAGERAIVMPARKGRFITSVQLIWEDGTKKFIFGGEVGGASHRIATGRRETWFCEGYATGLTMRFALKALSRDASIYCCFSASNVAAVARHAEGKRFIAADNDKPLPQFDGLGTGEHWARSTDLPFIMPPNVGTDFNDMHIQQGIFAVQKHLTTFLRAAGR